MLHRRIAVIKTRTHKIGRSSGEVAGVSDAVEIANVLISGAGKGEGQPEKEMIESKMKSRCLAKWLV